MIRAGREGEQAPAVEGTAALPLEDIMDLPSALPTVLDDVEALIRGIRPDQLGAPTPCAKFTVKDLCNHLVGGGHMFAGALRGGSAEGIDGPMPDLVGDDVVGAWKGARDDFDAACAEPGVRERMVTLPFATLPADVALSIAALDLLVHSWDLSRATGQPFTPNPELVEAATAFAPMIIAPEMRDGDTFAAEVTPPEGADALTRLIAFTGRAV